MLERYWNWKKHPASVFYLAVPLALIGFGLLFARAILEYQDHGNPWFVVINAVGVVVLAVALWPPYRLWRRLLAADSVNPGRQ